MGREMKDEYIFISYSHRDTKVKEIVDRMEKDGYPVWYDTSIVPGSEWDEHIAKKINECGYFIAFISENSLNSSNCKDELSYARDKDKERLLVYLENVSLPDGMQMRLGRLQAIHKWTYEDEDEFYTKLYSAQGIERFKTVSNETKEDTAEESSSALLSKDFFAVSDIWARSEVKVLSFAEFTEWFPNVDAIKIVEAMKKKGMVVDVPEGYEIRYDSTQWEQFLLEEFELKKLYSQDFPEGYFDGYNEFLLEKLTRLCSGTKTKDLKKPDRFFMFDAMMFLYGRTVQHKTHGNGIFTSGLSEDGNVMVYFDGVGEKTLKLEVVIRNNLMIIDFVSYIGGTRLFSMNSTSRELREKLDQICGQFEEAKREAEIDAKAVWEELAAEERDAIEWEREMSEEEAAFEDLFKTMEAEAKMDFEEEEQYSESEFMTEWEEHQREEAEERNWMRDEIEEWNSDGEGEDVLWMGDFVPCTTYDEEDMSDFDSDYDMPY